MIAIPQDSAARPDDTTGAASGAAEIDSPEGTTRAGLAALDVTDVPSLEILIFDEIANWIFSPENPGTSYAGEHGGAVVTAVLNAAQGAGRFRPDRVPVESPEIAAMRARLVEGGHQIAAAADALGMFVITLMPAVISELERRSGDPGGQLYWIYCYSLLVLAGGRSGELDETLMPAIIATFDGWNELMSQGYTLPWRAA